MNKRGGDGGGGSEINVVLDTGRDREYDMWQELEREEICLEKERVESKMKLRFFCRESW